jgi:hypothetical protein
LINFRYHVISLTAVFLALAIGLVVGTAALNGPVADSLQNQVSALTKQNSQYRSQVGQLESEAGKQEQFATELAPIVLQNKLTGRQVVVVSMPGTSAFVQGVMQDLLLAGAKVTGQIELEDKFTDPDSNETLLDLSSTLPVGITNAPANSNGAETASFLLGSVLTRHTPALTAGDVRTAITAFKEANFIVPTGDPTGNADAIVFIAPQPYTDQQAAAENQNLLTVATQFDKVGPEVLAANGASGGGNPISEVRGDPTLSKTVSTVDNVATPYGQVATSLAVDERLSQNKAGHYGVAGGATALLPKFAS